MAESQAGIGQPTDSIPFRTLDRQRPDFIIDNSSNQTCSNDQTCLISWTIQSDGGAPLIRAEISLTEVKKKEDEKLCFVSNRLIFRSTIMLMLMKMKKSKRFKRQFRSIQPVENTNSPD